MFDRGLNVLGSWMYLRIWICKSSEFAFGSVYPGSECHVSEYARQKKKKERKNNNRIVHLHIGIVNQ